MFTYTRKGKAMGRPPKHRTELGRTILRLRRQHGWSREDLARRAGLHPSVLSKVEQGHSEVPRVSTLQKLAAALRISVLSLLGCIPKDGKQKYTSS